eukprot:1847377-Prymnesium_polylepis.2
MTAVSSAVEAASRARAARAQRGGEARLLGAADGAHTAHQPARVHELLKRVGRARWLHLAQRRTALPVRGGRPHRRRAGHADRGRHGERRERRALELGPRALRGAHAPRARRTERRRRRGSLRHSAGSSLTSTLHL